MKPYCLFLLHLATATFYCGLASAQSSSVVGSPQSSFSISPTGGTLYNISIDVPNGKNGLQPDLSLVYNSQSGLGVAGWGVNISGFSCITRGSKDIWHDGVSYGTKHEADDAYFLDGIRLIQASGQEGQNECVYHPEGDPFTDVIIHGTQSSIGCDIWFEVRKGGLVFRYGQYAYSQSSYYKDLHTKHIAAWYVDRVDDACGYYMEFYYQMDNWYVYPKRVEYGMNTHGYSGPAHKIQFEYDRLGDCARPFILENLKGKLDLRLRSIVSMTGNDVYRSYELQYDTLSDGTNLKYHRLKKVYEKNGYDEMLNPIELDWDFLPQMVPERERVSTMDSHIAGTDSIYAHAFFAQDISGDGISDIIEVNSVRKTGRGDGVEVIVHESDLHANGAVSYSHTFDTFLSDYGTQFLSMQSVDFNCDGIMDFILPIYLQNNNNNLYFKILRKEGTTIGFHERFGQPAFTYNLKTAGTTPLVATGDINNSGRPSVIILEASTFEGKYYGMAFHWDNGILASGGYYSFSINGPPERLFTGDFNNDGLLDLLVLCQNCYSVFFNKGGAENAIKYDDEHSYSSALMADSTTVSQGDFNGDGLVDFIMNKDGSTDWYYYLNNGDGTFYKIQAATLDIFGQSTSNDDDKMSCVVFDFDHDGKSDVLVAKGMYTGYNYQKTHFRWLRSIGDSLIEIKRSTSDRRNDARPRHFSVGDFNGDGLEELMNYGGDCWDSSTGVWGDSINIYRVPALSASSGKVISFTDGYGRQTDVSYSSLTDTGIYEKGTGATFPIVDLLAPLHVVTSVETDNGAAGTASSHYTYSSLRAHLQGKKLLGFMSTITTDEISGAQTTTTTSLNQTFYTPNHIVTTVSRMGSVVETDVQMSVNSMQNGKNYFAYPSQTTATNADGDITTTTRSYDLTNGNILQEHVENGSNGGWSTTSYNGYAEYNGLWLPDEIVTSQNVTNYGSPYTSRKVFTYNAQGLPLETVENDQSSLALTTSYTYDAYGNVVSSTTSGSGLASVTQHKEYDISKRFVKKTYTTPVSTVTSYTYDTWGNLYTMTDETDYSNPLTTTYAYDGWGTISSMTSPQGQTSSFSRHWDRDGDLCYYELFQPAGGAWRKIWYDNCGRKLMTQSVGAGNVEMGTETTYDNLGRVIIEESWNGDVLLSDTYGYDHRDRVTSHTSSSGISENYTYAYRQTTKTGNGRVRTAYYDRQGRITGLSDGGEDVAYYYAANGQLSGAGMFRYGGFSLTYDDAGNRTGINDQDAGTSTYTYNAAGQLLSQTDARGVTTTNTYDALNRLIRMEIGNIATTHTYGTTGSSIGRVVRSDTGNKSIAYEYDIYGNVIRETRVIGNEQYQFDYTYNDLGQLTSTSYPGGLTVEYTYDVYGNQTQMSIGGTTVWRLEDTDGQTTTMKMGSQLTLTQTLDDNGNPSGLLMKQGAQTLHHLTFNFNGATGNLTHRTGMRGSANENGETFVYDNLERLVHTNVDGHVDEYVTYDGYGNIVSKTGCGTYGYNDRQTHAHAVTSVTNPNGTMQGGRQAVEYNSLGKISMLTDYPSLQEFTWEYGPDEERWGMVIRNTNNNDEWHVRYLGNMDVVYSPDVYFPTYYYYLGHNVLVVDIHGDVNIYYMLTDHLGSVVDIYNSIGQKVFAATYDSWGKQTVTQNTIGFRRGYCGHEMLPGVDLINMNGRVYDPVLGRFLSPDKFIQAPEESQNFNRYSYCLNNPLKYVDPNGELFGAFGFYKGLYNFIFKRGKITDPITFVWKDAVNSLKVTWGLTKGNVNQIISRFTWELPQTIVGYHYSIARINLDRVDKVRYFDGATYVIRISKGKSDGISIGNFININHPTIPTDSKGHFVPYLDPLYMHEYGHYLQSQDYGWGYLTTVGIPSLFSARNSKVISTPPFTTHRSNWMEKSANRKANSYFKKQYDKSWDDSFFYHGRLYPIYEIYPL